MKEDKTLCKAKRQTDIMPEETLYATYGMIEDLVFTLSSWHKAEACEVVRRFGSCVSDIPRADLDDVFVALDKIRRLHEAEN